MRPTSSDTTMPSPAAIFFGPFQNSSSSESRIVDETGLAIDEIEFNCTDLQAAWMDNKEPIDCADAELSTWPGACTSNVHMQRAQARCQPGSFRERLKKMRTELDDQPFARQQSPCIP